MNCEEVKKAWDDYIKGTCSPEREQEIDLHVEGCESCQHLLEQQAEKEQPDIADKNRPIQSKRFIRNAKLKNRLSNVLTVVLFGISILLLSSLVTNLFYIWNDKIDRAMAVNQTFFQMTSNNMTLHSKGAQTTPFMKVNYEFTVEKRVGKEYMTIDFHEPSLFFNRYTGYDFKEGVSLTDMEFVNRYLYNPEADERIAWKTLEKLPEGTVSEVAFTFKDAMKYEQLFEIISRYDIQLAWAGIEKEDMKQLEDELLYPGLNVIGMNEDSMFELMMFDNSISGIADGDSKAREERYLKSLQFLIDNKHYTNQLNGKGSIKRFNPEKALQYAEENGINLYGAILTGPTKELLKLEQEVNILYASMGEVEFWNWDKW